MLDKHDEFHRLATTAFPDLNVSTGLSRHTCRVTGTGCDVYRLRVSGAAISPEQPLVSAETDAAAIDAAIRQVKAARRAKKERMEAAAIASYEARRAYAPAIETA